MNTSAETVALTLKWPKKLFEALEQLAKRERTSKQTLITEAVLDKYNVQHWRQKQDSSKQKEIEFILRRYNYVPSDVQEKINEIMFDRQVRRMNE